MNSINRSMVIEINRYLIEGLMTAELKTHFSSDRRIDVRITDPNQGTLRFNRTEIVNAFPEYEEEDAYDHLLNLLNSRFGKRWEGHERFYWCVRDDQHLWLDSVTH